VRLLPIARVGRGRGRGAREGLEDREGAHSPRVLDDRRKQHVDDRDLGADERLHAGIEAELELPHELDRVVSLGARSRGAIASRDRDEAGRNVDRDADRALALVEEGVADRGAQQLLGRLEQIGHERLE